MIDAVTRANEASANIHRGVHTLSVEATAAYEAVRKKVARLLHARDANEIVFVRGTTEAINLVAQSYGRANVRAGDEVVVSELEHHSNLVPWQMLCEAKGATLRMLPIDERGDVRLESLDSLLSARTRIVAVSHVSNSLGTVLPIAEISRRAHAVGAVIVVDGAQAVAHRAVDVEALGCDFYAFSGHKMYGPTGSGVLYGRRALLSAMPPWQGGGDMVRTVSFAHTTYAEAPHRFEAGTPDITATIGLGAAIDWFLSLDRDQLQAREERLVGYARAKLGEIVGLRFMGDPEECAAIIPFNVGDIHPHDIGTALDLEGIAVRTGHHCTQPVMEHFGVDATVRASVGAYSTHADIDALIAGLRNAIRTFGGL